MSNRFNKYVSRTFMIGTVGYVAVCGVAAAGNAASSYGDYALASESEARGDSVAANALRDRASEEFGYFMDYLGFCAIGVTAAACISTSNNVRKMFENQARQTE